MMSIEYKNFSEKVYDDTFRAEVIASAAAAKSSKKRAPKVD